MLSISALMDEIMFSHNGANKADVTFRRVRQVTTPGEKSDVYDCFVGFRGVLR